MVWRVVEVAAWAVLLPCAALVLAVRAARFVAAVLIPALFALIVAAGVVRWAIEG